MSIGFSGFIELIGFIGDKNDQDVVDPAFIVTNNGATVTHNGSAVTLGTNISPALIVMHESSVLTHIGRIVTNGA